MASYEEVDEFPSDKKGKPKEPAGESSMEEVAPEDVPAGGKHLDYNMMEGDTPYLDSFLQGVSSDYWDEGAAKLESMFSDRPYREHWQDRQDELKRMRLLYPAESIAGGIGGSITQMLPILGWAKWLGKGAKMFSAATKFKQAADVARGSKAILTAAEVAKASKAVQDLSMLQRLGTGAWNTAKTGLKMTPAAAAWGALQSTGAHEKPIFDWDKEYENPFDARVKYPAFVAGKGAIEGMMSVPLAMGVGAVAKPFINLGGMMAKPVARKALEILSKPMFGVEKEAAKHILKNPELYDTPIQSVGKIAKNIVIPKVNEISAKTTAAKADAMSHLTDKRTFSVNELEEMFFDALQKDKLVFEGSKGKLTGSNGEGPAAAFNNARETIKQTAGAKGFVTEKELHDLYEHFSNKGLYNKPGLEGVRKEMAEAYRAFRTGMNKKLRANTQYNEKMVPVRQMTKDLDDMQKALKLQKRQGKTLNPVTGEPFGENGRYTIGDGKLEGKLRGSMNTNEHAVETMDDFSRTYFPEDVLTTDLLKRAAIEQKLEKGGGVGFKTLATQAAPWWIRAPAMALDVYGRKAFKKLAKIATPNQSTSFDTATRAFLPAVTDFGVGPWTNPYYVGFPLHGMSGEQYRELKEQGKVK